MKEVRCTCGRLLGKLQGRYEIKCPKCKTLNKGEILAVSSWGG